MYEKMFEKIDFHLRYPWIQTWRLEGMLHPTPIIKPVRPWSGRENSWYLS